MGDHLCPQRLPEWGGRVGVRGEGVPSYPMGIHVLS